MHTLTSCRSMVWCCASCPWRCHYYSRDKQRRDDGSTIPPTGHHTSTGVLPSHTRKAIIILLTTGGKRGGLIVFCIDPGGLVRVALHILQQSKSMPCLTVCLSSGLLRWAGVPPAQPHRLFTALQRPACRPHQGIRKTTLRTQVE